MNPKHSLSILNTLSLSTVVKGFPLSIIAASIALCGVTKSYAEEVFEGESMVVIGSRVEQELEDIPGSVSVVTDEEIEQFMMTDLESLFRYEPGISTSGSGAQPQTITVRGVGGNRLVYIKDGRRGHDGYAGGGGFIVGRGYLNTDTIRQIEVARGAASSLYGSDGLGGIVVISTKDPEDYLFASDTYLSVGSGYQGASGELRFDVTGAARAGDWLLSGAYTRTDGEEVQNYSGSLPGYESRSDAFLVKAQYQINSEQWLKFTVDHYQQEVEQIIAPDSNESLDKDRNTAFSIDYSSERKHALWDSLDMQVYFSQFEQNSDQIVASSRGYTDFNDYSFEQGIWGLRAVFTKDITSGSSTHTLVYGLDHDDYDTSRPRIKTRVNADGTIAFTDTPQAAFPGADTNLTGLFLQNNIDIEDSAWTFILGGRIDFYDMQPKDDPLYDAENIVAIDETAFSPKLGAIFQLNPEVSFYGQYVEGFKIPPHDQAYQSHGVEPFYQILPNSELESEESQTIELGMRINSTNWAMEINGFYSQFDNFIESTLIGFEDTFIPGVSKQLFQYQNLDDTLIKGLEFSINHNINSTFDWRLNAAWAEGENKKTDQPLTSISPIQGNLLVDTSIQSWLLTAALRFANSMNDVPRDDEGGELIKSSGYGVVDLFAQYEADNWRFSAGIENLFDKEYVRYESIAGLDATAGTEQFTETGREFSADIQYFF